MDGVIRVIVVAEDEELFLALSSVLGHAETISIEGPIVDVPSIGRRVATSSSMVAVVDLDGPSGRGMQMLGEVRDAVGGPVLVATSQVDVDVLARALSAGACGVLPHGDDAADLILAIRRAVSGELVLPARDLSALVDQLRPPVDLLYMLTVRERQTLSLLAEGLSTVDVAFELGISPATVQTHIKNVLAKLGVHSKVQAVRVALLSGV
jgi:DNA-binding NarL/FixJ family response regulator